jgi:uncharacterized protein YbjT (DUF2867 family)
MSRIFLAGATGVIGIRLIPLMLAQGHSIVGMTRTPAKAAQLRELGVEPVVCDVYDVGAVTEAVVAAQPGLVMHQLTDLPDDAAQLASSAANNDRIRKIGTANLLAAAKTAQCGRFIAQSIAWRPAGDRAAAVEEFERAVLDADGVVIEYGQLYGPGTYYPTDPPAEPRIQIDAAAERTMDLLDEPSGVYRLVD